MPCDMQIKNRTIIDGTGAARHADGAAAGGKMRRPSAPSTARRDRLAERRPARAPFRT
jgi:hypothetical protein